MKKNIIIGAVVAFAFGISTVGCGSTKKIETGSIKEETTVETKEIEIIEPETENKLEKEETEDMNFSDEEKSMMAGKSELSQLLQVNIGIQNKRVRTIVVVVEQSYLALKRNMTVVVDGQVFINPKIILR